MNVELTPKAEYWLRTIGLAVNPDDGTVPAAVVAELIAHGLIRMENAMVFRTDAGHAWISE